MSRYFYTILSGLVFILLIALSSQLSSINQLHSSLLLFLWVLYMFTFTISFLIHIPFSIQKTLLFLFTVGCALLFIGHELNPVYFSFLPHTATQFILRVANEHNNLGDLAGLALSALVASSSFNVLSMVGGVFFFLIIAISFSKSAFLSFFIILLIITIRKRGIYIVGLVSFLLLSILVVGIYTAEFSHLPFIRNSQTMMQRILHLKPKPLLSVRDSYYPQVVRVWKTAPLEQKLFGYGSGNYIYPSVKTGASTDLTPPETHNILLSIFIENGPLTALWFIIFCVLILYFGFKESNPTAYLFLYLLINFQTHYAYIIPFFMILFFFFAGQSTQQSSQKIERVYVKIAGIILMIGLLLLTGLHYRAIRNKKRDFDSQLTQAAKQNNNQLITNSIANLETITPYEEFELVRWSALQEQCNNGAEAVRLLDKLSLYSPRWYLLYLPKQMEIMKNNKIDIQKYLTERKKDFAQFPFSKEEKKQLNDICQEYAKMKCAN